MHIKIDRSALMKTLAHVQNVVEKKNAIQILGNVMLSAKSGRVTVVATNMEIVVAETIDAEILAEGECTASAAVLYEITRKLPDGASIELRHKDDMLAYRAGRYHMNLATLPVVDFPQMSTGRLSHNFRMPALALKSLLDRTAFAASDEESRYYLCGVYLHIAEADRVQVLRAVATNGHELAYAGEPLPDGAAGMPGVILPRQTLSELRKLLADAQGEISLGVSETRMQIAMGDLALVTKLIDGTFPEYERVIPRDNDKVLRVAKSDFAAAVGRVAVVGGAERSKPVKLTLGPDRLTLSASGGELGSATEELDGSQVHYSGPAYEIGFQARYLNDITDQIGGCAEFRFGPDDAPALILDAADASALFVLMPMRV